MGKIYPAYLIDANTPLGYDGTDYRAFKQDITGNVDPSLRVSLIPDRGLSKVVNTYSASLANHATTTRYTYTVPSGKAAVLEAATLYIAAPASGTLCVLTVLVNDTVVVLLGTESTSTPYQARVVNWSGQIWLKAGDTVKVQTYSSDTTARLFTATTCISEFVK